MGFWDTILLGVTFLMLAVAAYLFVNEINVENTSYKNFVANVTMEVGSESKQFYPNMRFSSNDLGYMIEPVCSEENKLKIIEGLKEIDDKTSLLSFHPSNTPDIIYECTSKSPTTEERKNHVVAGAAKPRFINASKFFVIQQTNISLFVEETCDRPIVIIHETLHALGFDHVNDEDNIMYPIAKCDQEIKQDTVDEIDRLYAIPSEPDLVIVQLTANTTRRYLNFGINISNFGLDDANDVKLVISGQDGVIEEFEMQNIGVGQTKILNVQNLHIPASNEGIKFTAIDRDRIDLNPEDNVVEIRAEQNS